LENKIGDKNVRIHATMLTCHCRFWTNGQCRIRSMPLSSQPSTQARLPRVFQLSVRTLSTCYLSFFFKRRQCDCKKAQREV